MERVYITGMGSACGLGMDLDALWSHLDAGQCSIELLPQFGEEFRSRIGAPVPQEGLVLPEYDLKPFSELCIRYALHAGQQAILQANLMQRDLDKRRIGVIISTGFGGIGSVEAQHRVLLERGPGRVSPYFIPNAIPNTPCGLLALLYGFQGLSMSVSSACSSSTQALGLGLRLIQSGDLDVCVVGGTEQGLTPCGMAGFSAQRALSTRNHDPKKACRPWDRARDGFVMADGAGVLVLERATLAERSAPNICAELVDVGWSNDAHHFVQPDPSGQGAERAMRDAMRTLKDYSVVDYINAHATGTSIGDLIEPKIIQEMWGNTDHLCVSATKSMHGHLLGAAGAIEAIVTVLAIQHARVPPTINCPDPEVLGLHLVRDGSISHPIRYALSNSFGFGGTNATLLFRAV